MNSQKMKDTCDLLMETHEEFIRVRTGIERLLLPIAQSFGLTPTQIAVLNLIRKFGRATVSTLFKALDFNQGNMSSLCKRLENDGFITREKCTEDERKSYLILTEKADEALGYIDTAFHFTDSECWLTQEEFDEAEKALETLRVTAKKINVHLNKTMEERKIK